MMSSACFAGSKVAVATVHGYPRPQLQRKDWVSLNGFWDFAIDAEGVWCTPSDVAWSGTIRVPFAPETPASSVGRTDFFRACWYRREVVLPPLESNQRVLLHFGAVDYHATVWINGCEAGRHHGGYTPFRVDLTHFSQRGRVVDRIVGVFAR